MTYFFSSTTAEDGDREFKMLTEEDMVAILDQVRAEADKPHVHIVHPKGRICLDCGMIVR